MKIRNGFISNSSSSSFIINEIDISSLEIYNIDIIKAIEILERYKKCIEEYSNIVKEGFGFIHQGIDTFTVYNPFEETIEKLEKLIEKYPNCYITEPVDRDWAYDNPILCHKECFMTDL